MPPSLTPGSILGPRMCDRIPGMPKIKGPELREKIYLSNCDPKGQIAHKEHTPKKIYNQNTSKPRGGYVSSQMQQVCLTYERPETPIHYKRRYVTNYSGPQLQRIKKLCCPTSTWPGHPQNNLCKYPLNNLGKATKVTSI